MTKSHILILTWITLLSSLLPDDTFAQSFGSGPITVVPGPPLIGPPPDLGISPGEEVGTYTALENHDDGSYTLHYITVDTAGIVTNHTSQEHTSEEGEDLTIANASSLGKLLGDVIAERSLSLVDPSSSPAGGMCFSAACDSGSPMSQTHINFSIGE